MSAMSPLEAENTNYLWAQLLLEEWRRQGMRYAIVCPGSRSSPLAIAAARTRELTTIVVTDERCAGFIALGIAKVSGVPAAVITTSGTAGANLLPAAVEATMSGTPLLLVTADRPPELHDCGANQAIPQSGLFGTFAVWSLALGCPSADVDPIVVLSGADEAWERATGARPGAVHINCPFREPLGPRPCPATAPPRRLREWADSQRPWRERRLSADPGWIDEPIAVPEGPLRGAVVCGVCEDDRATGRIAAEVSAQLNWPLLADIGAQRRGMRSGAGGGPIEVPDSVLAACEGSPLRERLAATVVYRVGGPITSKRLQGLVQAAPLQIVMRHRGHRHDERHGARVLLEEIKSSDDRVFTMLGPSLRQTDDRYLGDWVAAGRISVQAIAAAHDARDTFDEPWVARAVCAASRSAGARLLLGNSMPIRDADAFVGNHEAPGSIIVNRGASGIDGLVSTAVGAALGSAGSTASGHSRPTIALLGDLSLLHDLGGLLFVGSAPGPVHVVVVNNDGGGIFRFLPIMSEPSAAPHLEPLFGTPHGRSFEQAAAMFGLAYRRVATRSACSAALAELSTADHSMLIECLTDRHQNVESYRRLQGAAARALARELP